MMYMIIGRFSAISYRRGAGLVVAVVLLALAGVAVAISSELTNSTELAVDSARLVANTAGADAKAEKEPEGIRQVLEKGYEYLVLIKKDGDIEITSRLVDQTKTKEPVVIYCTLESLGAGPGGENCIEVASATTVSDIANSLKISDEKVVNNIKETQRVLSGSISGGDLPTDVFPITRSLTEAEAKRFNTPKVPGPTTGDTGHVPPEGLREQALSNLGGGGNPDHRALVDDPELLRQEEARKQQEALVDDPNLKRFGKDDLGTFMLPPDERKITDALPNRSIFDRILGGLRGLGGSLGGLGGGLGNLFGGGQSSGGANQQAAQNAQVCQPQYFCSNTNTLSYRNSSCQSQFVQTCSNGCGGNECRPAVSSSTRPTSASATSTSSQAAPVAELSCAPSTADSGSPISISWSCRNASDSEGTGFDTGGAKSGSAATSTKVASGNAQTVFFALTCKEGERRATDRCEVNVNRSFITAVANPSSVEAGEDVNVGWITGGMSSCTAGSSDFAGVSKPGTSGVIKLENVGAGGKVAVECTTRAGGSKRAEIEIEISKPSSLES